MLEILALHRLHVEAPVRAEYIGSVEAARIPERARSEVSRYLDGMASRSEGLGRAQSAWWTAEPPAPPPELLRLYSCPAMDFDDASRRAMDRLVTMTPAQARSGVVVFIRDIADGQTSLLCLKMVLSEESVTRFLDAADAANAIRVDDITNILPSPEELKKGALIPHPAGTAHLRVVDEQMREAAEYWMKFLGARARSREPDLAKLAAGTVFDAVVWMIQDEERARSTVAAELDRVVHGDERPSVRDFVQAVGTRAEIDTTRLLHEVEARDPALLLAETILTPTAANRVDTLIELDDGIKIRGPAWALDGRWRARQKQDGTGWVLEIDSVRRPEPKRVLRAQ